MRGNLKLVEADDASWIEEPRGVRVAAPRKSLLRFITCGSVDDGKSTLLGRILYETGAVFDDQLDAVRRDSARFGTTGDDLDFALLVDGLSAEREQGITIDVAYRYFSTERRAFIAADTPGHEQYTRNMATGASTADTAIILVDARKGILPQTRRHSYIVSMLGVRRVIVAVNKIDLVDYDEATFRAIERDYRTLAASLGFVETHIVPVSARFGDNVVSPSARTPWRSGPALLPLLESIEATATDDAEFRFPVQIVNRPNLDFRGYSGMIASGEIAVGDAVVALPRGRASRVAAILGPSGAQDRAVAGQSVTLTLSDEIDVSRGDVLVRRNSTIAPVRRIDARLLGLSETPVSPGRRYVVKIGATTTTARIAALHHAVDVHTYDHVAAADLPMNAIGAATLNLETDVVASEYARCRSLGGLLLIDPYTNETAALGVVEAEAAAAEREGERETSVGARLLRLASRAGLVGAPGRALDAAVGAALAGLVVLVLTGRPAFALASAGADVFLRPPAIGIARRLSARISAGARRRREASLTVDGGGI